MLLRWLLTISALLVPFCLSTAQDYVYTVVEMQESKEDGTLINQQPLSGKMTLKGDFTYTLEAESSDSGTWALQQAQNGQPARLMFTSSQGASYFAYVQDNAILIWLTKTESGTHLWARAVLENGQQQGASIKQGAVGIDRARGVFSRGVIYGALSGSMNQYMDRETGQYLGTDQTGFIFHSDGTFLMQNSTGGSTIRATGTYSIDGDQLLCQFDQGGDDILFMIANGGATIQWISNGQVFTEYQFLGSIR